MAPSRVVAVAVNTSLIADDADARRAIAAVSAETGLPADDPVRFGAAALWAEVRDAVDALPWVAGQRVNAGWDLRVETLHLPFRDPFVIARNGPGEGHGVTTVIVELRSPRCRGWSESARVARRRTTGRTPSTMAVVMPLLLGAVPPDGARVGGGPGAAREALAAIGAAFDGGVRGHGAAKCALDIALHDLAGKALGVPIHRLLGLSADIPPTDFTLGLDEPAVVAERARRSAHFPALKIKVGGPHDLATLEAVRGVFGGPIRVDANIGWTPESAARDRPGAGPAGRRADRAALPAPALRLAPRPPGDLAAPDRRRRVGGRDRGPRRARRGRGRRQREARQVRRRGPGRSDADAGPRPRVPDLPRLHGGDVGGDRGIGGRREPGGVG